jgi:HTH-type transcriptional regulator / antitoxin HigA
MPLARKKDFSKNLYPLKVIKNDAEYQEAMKSMEAVFDETEGSLADYAETLTLLIEKYEESLPAFPKASGIEVVKFMMDQNGLKQKDLAGILGGKSTVSELLNGKRPFNLNHIRILAKKFNVRPATFI